MNVRLCLGFNAVLILGMLIAAAEEQSNSSKPSLLLQPAELQQKLNDKDLRILDVRSENDYAEAHIPGAVRVDVGDWKSLAASENGLHDAKRWAEKIGSFGIDGGTHVVVYGSNVTDTARIWWLLKYVGVTNVSILDGGWQWWTKIDRPVEESTPQVSAKVFTPKFQADRLAEIETVKNSLRAEQVKVVDTRSDGEFASGHIPDAVHLEWTHLLAENGRFKSPTELKRIFRDQGILPTETAVCY